MSLIEYCTESEQREGCLGTEWLSTPVIVWLTGGCPAQHHKRGSAAHPRPGKREVTVQNWKYSF